VNTATALAWNWPEDEIATANVAANDDNYDAQRGNLILWQIRQQDAQRNPIDIKLGNGLTQLRDYDKKDNRLRSALIGVPTRVP
jgi:hypothetical protein